MNNELTREELRYLVELVTELHERYNHGGEKRYCAFLSTLINKLVAEWATK